MTWHLGRLESSDLIKAIGIALLIDQWAALRRSAFLDWEVQQGQRGL
jgi:hypothetical protein